MCDMIGSMYLQRSPRRLLQTMLLVGALLGLTACASIPKRPERLALSSRPPVSAGLLKDASEAVLKRGDDGGSAFMRINGNAEALRWRLALIDHAQDSIDLQVFIWTNDESGRLMVSRLIAAAERGVRIRLLVDDLPKDWSDRETALFAQREGIHVRRFNPGRVRKGILGRSLQMSTQFRQLNRRMHNKQMIVDGRWAIAGGRNIGNPYFGVSKKYNNRDLDMLITGAVIREMAAAFDQYWSNKLAYPGEAMHGSLSESKRYRAASAFNKKLKSDSELWENAGIETGPVDWSETISELPGRMLHGKAVYLQDSPPVKGVDTSERLVDQLRNALPPSRKEIHLITPYFIPESRMLEDMSSVVSAGLRYTLVVPGMDANNHTMVHGHYKKYRKPILEAGVGLFELKSQPGATIRSSSDTPPVKAKFICLHTKLIIQDRELVCLGSLNIDPRSIKINTENMLIIESRELASGLIEDIEMMTAPENAWEVALNEKGKIRWRSGEDERTRQPARSTLQRVKCFFYRLLPIEGQL